MLTGCDNVADRQEGKQESEKQGRGTEPVQQDKGTPKEARKSTDKRDTPAKQAEPAKADEDVNEISYKGKPLADWIARLQDKDAGTRVEAARALGNISRSEEGRPPAVFRALARAFKDKDETVRFVAFESLKCYGEHAVPVLAEALKDEDAKVRRLAAGNLGDLYLRCRSADSTRAVGSALGGALLKDKKADVRLMAATELGRMGEPGVPALLSALKSHDADSRRTIISVLHNGASDVAPRRNVVPAVAECLKDEDAGLRRDAAMLIGELGDRAGAALPALLTASKAEDKGGEAAREALQKVHKAPRPAAPELLAFLKDPEPRVRLKAAEALCDLEEGDKECLAVLLELVKRRDSQVRQETARLLYRYGSAAKDAVPALIEIARNDLQARANAVSTLGAIGPDAKAAVTALKAAARQDERVEGLVKEALLKIEQ
jgi:HEAT repeat protein